VIPLWAETALAKRVQEPSNGFDSYGAVQQWLLETLGVDAQYHAVYQMTRYRLKAKLKVARPHTANRTKPNERHLKKPSRRPRLIESVLSAGAPG
jgi:hypothetical protein